MFVALVQVDVRLAGWSDGRRGVVRRRGREEGGGGGKGRRLGRLGGGEKAVKGGGDVWWREVVGARCEGVEGEGRGEEEVGQVSEEGGGVSGGRAGRGRDGGGFWVVLWVKASVVAKFQ